MLRHRLMPDRLLKRSGNGCGSAGPTDPPRCEAGIRVTYWNFREELPPCHP